MTTEHITLEMSFPDGEGSLTVGRDHPLVSVFRRAVHKGTYTGEWLLLAVRPALAEKPKLLGTVAWTQGERFLFFPGKPVEVHSTHPDKSLNGSILDHVTLELDEAMSRFAEHVAVLGRGSGESHGQTRRGTVHEGHLHPWFSLLLRSLEGYEALPAIFKFEFPIPHADVQRRVRAILGRGKRTATAFPVPESEGTHYYYQVDVWAGRGKGWQKEYADALPWPTLDGVVVGHRGEPVTRAAQIHELTADCGIITVFTRPSGSLQAAGLIHAAIQPAKTLGH